MAEQVSLMRLLVLTLSILAGVVPAQAAPEADPAAVLHALFATEWERDLREDPLLATYLGDRRYDDRWPDLSPDALARSHAADRAVLAALAAIPTGSLAEGDRLNQTLFGRVYQAELDAFAWGLHYLPVN